MNKDFLNYELSLELQKLGFENKCFAKWRQDREEEWYDPRKGEEITLGSNNIYLSEGNYPYRGDRSLLLCGAPLPYQAFKFFRDEYGKFALIFSDGYQWTYDLRWSDPEELDKYPSVRFPIKEVGREMYNTYEEAEIKAIEKLIEIVKTTS